MPFTYTRTIRFQDTDSAGVVYFANVLAMCHEAYEESLLTSSINLKSFFSNPSVALPIVHASVDFFRPMFCGDEISIHLLPHNLTQDKFEIDYIIATTMVEQLLAKAITRHVCIDPINRARRAIPSEIVQWFQQYT